MLRDLLRRDIGLGQLNNPKVPLYEALAGLGDGPVDAGVTVTTTSAMRVMAVYACVRLIAETCAALPLKTFTGDGPGRQEVKLASERYIWGQPNPEQTQQVFWEQAFASALLDGNAFINTARDQAGRIAELWVVNPAVVQIERDSAGTRYYVVDERVMSAQEIVHIPAFSLPGQLRGLSPIGQARQAIGLSLAAERFGARLFGSGSIPSGVLQAAGPIDEVLAKTLKQRWREMHAGVDRAWEVAVLGNGLEFKPLAIPPEDAQFLETRRFQLSEIARLFRVPPHLIADVERSTSWGSGIEEQNIAFIQYTLLPWLRRFEQAITTYLLPVRPRYARFVLDGLLRGDAQARVAYYSAGRRDGWLSPDDIRRLEDMPPLPNGQGQVYQLTPTGAAPNAPAGAPAEEDTHGNAS